MAGQPATPTWSHMPSLARALPLLLLTVAATAQDRRPTPARQSTLDPAATTRVPVSLRDASRNDRWLGLGPRDLRWAPDGQVLYFRWHLTPTSRDLPEADPWFRTDRDGTWIEQVPTTEAGNIPAEVMAWNAAGDRAAWATATSVFTWDGTRGTRRVVSLEQAPSDVRFAERDAALHFTVGESLVRYDLSSGSMAVIAARVTVDRPPRTAAATRLALEAQALSSQLRDRLATAAGRAAVARQAPGRPMPIPAATGTRVEAIQLSPDGRHLTFRLRTIAANRPPTRYMDYNDPSGYARPLEARGKTGEPRDRFRLGVIPMDPTLAADSVAVRWVDLAEAGQEPTVPHGPFWNPDGSRAVVQYVGENDKDLWIAEVAPASGSARVITHDHDDAWIGGPPIQSNYTGPALFEWLADGSFVFASERGGWSHLHRVDAAGARAPLTSGAWEVRGAVLSRDRRSWLLQGSRDGAAEDHLYMMGATGGELTRLTTTGGRNTGSWSPDGSRLAILRSSSTALPDLFVATNAAARAERRVTVSGTDEWVKRRLVTPEIVSIPHPDGKPVYAALYKPARPNRARAALLHIHGGGYRQFAHLGWSVYGWSGHLGLLHHFLDQGYTVLDFDYRGSAGFGRDYRTDIAMSMGQKDVDGAVAAARWLVRTQGVDSTRIGIYGVSYGGFMTLMSQFRYPGVFAAGVSRAPVTDWSHYSDNWTSRILGVPQVDTTAYRLSSPIYHAEGLRDHLLIEHGLVDDNVHFQDTARLVQRLLELEKDFEVMYYPTEPHVVETEVSRFDQSKRAAAFFERWLLRR